MSACVKMYKNHKMRKKNLTNLPKHKQNEMKMHLKKEKWGQYVSASLNTWLDTFYFQNQFQSRNRRKTKQMKK